MIFDGLEKFRPPKYLTAHGSLDAILALAQPYARGDGDDPPELSMAPTATQEEASLLNL